MKKLLLRLFRALFLALTLAPVAVVASYLLLGSWQSGIMVYASALFLGALTTLLPARVGKTRTETIVQPVARAGGDPNPDRERPVVIEKTRGVRFPLRLLACAVLLLSLAAFGALFPIADAIWYMRGAYTLILAIPLAFVLRELPRPDSDWTGSGGVGAGAILYFIAGIILWALRKQRNLDDVNTALYLCAAAYAVLSAFMLNEHSMSVGVSARNSARPPAKIARANRLMVGIFAAALIVASLFDRLRALFAQMGDALKALLIRFFAWLGSLFGASEEIAEGAPAGGEGGGLQLPPGGEPAMFWVVMEKVFMVIAIALAAAVALWLMVRIGRAAARVVRKLLALLGRYAQSVSEDYDDVRETLLDWQEVRREMGDSLKKRLGKLFEREKRYEQMDPRERVRYIARGLYRRGSQQNLAALTFREAAALLDFKEASPEDACELYERARYSTSPVAPEEPDRLKKAVRL